MKRLGFAIAVMVLVLSAAEIAAHTWESTQSSLSRTIPTPAPSRDSNRELLNAFSERQEQDRQHNGLATPMVEDEQRGWALEPHRVMVEDNVTCRINSLGMRGPELTPKKPGEKRILALGDSSVFGSGVMEKDVFAVVAAAQLTQALGTEVSWAIGAVPGHDSGQALSTLELHGNTVNPDYVLVGTLWSDVYANFSPERNDRASSELKGRLRGLATYRLARRALAPWLRARKIRFIDSSSDIGPDPTGATSRVSLSQYIKNLREIGAKTESLGAKPVFIALPAPMDFDQVDVPETVLEYRAAMAHVAHESNAFFVDGPALFREQGAGIGWFLDQVHPNAAGHAILGGAISNTLKASAP
ncbi:MAG: SGNH/GDSL hydrolase family protein [Myxococcota bacterium]|nr:SGNH/GDSL hydrolase family protein [Myxococcota bacterium]